MKTKWFRAKKYGWGWKPITWQGWAVLVIYIAADILYFHLIDSHSHSVSDTLINFVPVAVILTLFLIAIAYRTGEKPRLQWGTPKKSSKKKKA